MQGLASAFLLASIQTLPPPQDDLRPHQSFRWFVAALSLVGGDCSFQAFFPPLLREISSLQ